MAGSPAAVGHGRQVHDVLDRVDQRAGGEGAAWAWALVT
jgi:hypothetical protein